MTAKKRSVAPKSARKSSRPSEPETAKALRRSDGGGHLDPLYKEELLRLSSRPPPARDAAPFIGASHTSDAFAEQCGEQAVEQATGAGEQPFDALDIDDPEDLVSPFRVNDGHQEEEEEEE